MKNIKNKKRIRMAAAIALAAAVAAVPAFAFAESGLGGARGGFPGGMGGWGSTDGSANYASEPSEIVTSQLTSNSAEALEADLANAETIVMNADNNNVKISKSGTYIVTGVCAEGNLAVKKGTTGVVLILRDLDLTSTTGATVSLNKGTEVKVIIEGTVTLSDEEDIADEDTDDFDGAALKAKAGSSVVLTGTGTLNVNGACKNGIKVSDLEEDDKADGYTEASFIVDGKGLTINVIADQDGFNSGTDLTIKSGNITVKSGDDGLKADYILTIGAEGTDGPTLNVTANETIEGAIINIYSGNITVNAEDDGINAANKDLENYTYSCNIMGGTINITAGADGIDSNGNINILGGLTTIVKSASNGGEGGIDYEGSCYVKEGCLVNPFGATFDSGMGGFPGGNGGQGGNGGMGGFPGGNGGFPGWNGDSGDVAPPYWSGRDGSQDWPTLPNGGVDSESGATPEIPDGTFPGGDGTFPGGDGSGIPEPPDGPIRGEDGQNGGNKGQNGQNGEIPAPPDRNGGSGDNPASPDGSSGNNGSQTFGEWIQNLWQTISDWFSELFSK